MTNRKVLILCTGNSARSQMAEGLLRELGLGKIEVFSAGTKSSVVNPLAIRVMAEHGIDISGQRSKHLDEFRAQPFDTVITVCDDAAEACPVFPGRAERIYMRGLRGSPCGVREAYHAGFEGLTTLGSRDSTCWFEGLRTLAGL